MALNESSDLFPNVRNPESTRVINERCRIKSQDGHCVVDVSGIVLAQYSSTDHMAGSLCHGQSGGAGLG